MAEKSAAINKSLRTTLRKVFQPGILFPKTTPPIEAEEIEKRNEATWDEIQKARKEIDRPFECASVEKAGGSVDPARSEASRLAWEKRERAKKEPDKGEKPSAKPDAPPAVPGPQRFVSHPGEHLDHVAEAVKGIAQMKDTTPAESTGLRSYGREATAGENIAALKDLIPRIAMSGFKLMSSGRENPRVDLFEHADGSSIEISRKREPSEVRRLMDIVETGLPEERIRELAAKLPEKISIRIVTKGEVKPEKPKTEKAVEQTVDIEKILKDSGFDRLPMTDKAKSIVEDAITKGARPVTEYTGKLMLERNLPEEPPAFVRPKQLKVGDRVVALQWMPMGVMGSKFDLPFVPPAVKVKKLYIAPVKVTKESFPPGQIPKDCSKLETVIEQRLWGLDVEIEEVKKEGGTLISSPLATRDTTLVMRLAPLASPAGETQD